MFLGLEPDYLKNPAQHQPFHGDRQDLLGVAQTVAPSGPAAYISQAFHSSPMNGFAHRAGEAQRRFPDGDRTVDAESHSRMAGREHLPVVRPDRTTVQPAHAGSK